MNGDDYRERANELEQVAEQMSALLAEARRIVSGTRAAARAEAYWLPGIRQAVEGAPHEGCSMTSTINELQDLAEDAYQTEDDD